MLVYCASFNLESSVPDVFNEVAAWLSKQLKAGVDAKRLMDGCPINKGKHQVQVAILKDEYPILYCVRYSHPDNAVRGRQWVVELGVQQNSSEPKVQCSILLETNEVSSRVEAPVQATRPILVYRLMESCRPVAQTPGREVILLGEDNAESIRNWIESEARKNPLVIVSPTGYGKYLADPEQLRFQLSGIADVIQIATDASPSRIGQFIGQDYAVKNGAAILIYPPSNFRGERSIYTRKFRSDAIEFGFQEEGFARELLSLVTHRMNLPNLRLHVSIDRVEGEKRHRKISRQQKQAEESGKFSAEYAGLLEKDNEDLRRRVSELEDKRAEMQTQISELEDQLDDKNSEVKEMGRSLQYSSGRQSEATLSEKFIQTLLETAQPNPEQSLTLLSEAFPERVVILDNAWKSARDSRDFDRKNHLLNLLWKLATEYWEALSQGGSDLEASHIFGAAFSPKESETIERNKRAAKERTFNHNGQPVTMFRHLKIGVKDSLHDTIRVHFEWDAENAKVIVGHCGRHLYIPGK